MVHGDKIIKQNTRSLTYEHYKFQSVEVTLKHIPSDHESITILSVLEILSE